MSYNRSTKTEHVGPKSSKRKSGFWGRRAEAKENCKKIRRQIDKESVNQQEKLK